jgi:hypothetical protein
MVVGDAAEEDGHHEKLSELATRVRDMNHRVADIRREQAYQRVGVMPTCVNYMNVTMKVDMRYQSSLVKLLVALVAFSTFN